MEGLLGGTVTVEVTRARGAVGVDGLRLGKDVGLVCCRVNIDESMNKVRWKMLTLRPAEARSAITSTPALNVRLPTFSEDFATPTTLV